MKNLFSNHAQILFLSQNSTPRHEGLFDVILSPQFYWVKKAVLPVKKVSEAKKLAASVFEGTLPEGTYAYALSKADDAFVMIAYNQEEISQELKKYFTDDAKVNAIYFAQYEFPELDACCTIDEESSLVNIDGLLMQVPRNCTDSKLEIETLLKDKKLSKNRIKLGTFDHEVMDKRTFALIAASVVFLLSATILEYIDYKKEAAKMEEAKMALIQKYELPRTSMQLRSIKGTLEKTFKNQKGLREKLYHFSKLPLEGDEYIKEIDMKEKESILKVKISAPQREQLIKSYIAKNYKILDSTLKDDILTLRVAS